jgi:hypothetical protein
VKSWNSIAKSNNFICKCAKDQNRHFSKRSQKYGQQEHAMINNFSKHWGDANQNHHEVSPCRW